uniref:Uncharacterized protein n=1 Tax=Rhizophora mucronata TaxID=61149 RepID=A0A2P2IQF2_RHIMU
MALFLDPPLLLSVPRYTFLPSIHSPELKFPLFYFFSYFPPTVKDL